MDSDANGIWTLISSHLCTWDSSILQMWLKPVLPHGIFRYVNVIKGRAKERKKERKKKREKRRGGGGVSYLSCWWYVSPKPPLSLFIQAIVKYTPSSSYTHCVFWSWPVAAVSMKVFSFVVGYFSIKLISGLLETEEKNMIKLQSLL